MCSYVEKNKDVSKHIYQLKSANMSNMCLPHGRSKGLCECVFLKSSVGNNRRRNVRVWKGRTYQEKGGGWHPSDMFPFSTVLNSPLPPLRNMYLVSERSHLTVVNTATEKEKNLLPALSHIWGAFIRRRENVCEFRKWILRNVKGKSQPAVRDQSRTGET